MHPSLHRIVSPAVLLALLALTGCAAHRIREAQDAFSRAAALENRGLDVTAPAQAALLDNSSAAGDYRRALSLVNESLAKSRDRLQQDQLEATALMLKALCLWRLADLEDDHAAGEQLSHVITAIHDRANSNKAPPLTLGTRDRVLLAALPGLRDHDRGLRQVTRGKAGEMFSSAFNKLDNSLKQDDVPENHPVVIYIRLAQLSVCRAWQAAIFRFVKDTSEAAKACAVPRGKFRDVVGALRPCWKTNAALKRQLQDLDLAMGAGSQFD